MLSGYVCGRLHPSRHESEFCKHCIFGHLGLGKSAASDVLLDSGYETALYCRSLQLICMHYGISSGRNAHHAMHVDTTLDKHVHLLGRVGVRC